MVLIWIRILNFITDLDLAMQIISAQPDPDPQPSSRGSSLWIFFFLPPACTVATEYLLTKIIFKCPIFCTFPRISLRKTNGRATMYCGSYEMQAMRHGKISKDVTLISL